MPNNSSLSVALYTFSPAKTVPEKTTKIRITIKLEKDFMVALLSLLGLMFIDNDMFWKDTDRMSSTSDQIGK